MTFEIKNLQMYGVLVVSQSDWESESRIATFVVAFEANPRVVVWKMHQQMCLNIRSSMCLEVAVVYGERILFD